MKKFFLLICCMAVASFAFANNVTISNLSLTGQTSTPQAIRVQFSISWDNSWATTSGPANSDAIWIFVKYKDPATLTWKHAYISPTAANHTAPAGSTIKPATDGTGVMLSRSALGSGSVNYANVQLQWAYSNNGVADPNATEVTVQAVEMVYVPQGAFYIGDGTGSAYTSSSSSFFAGTNDQTRLPALIDVGLSSPINRALGNGFTYNNSFRVSGLVGIDWNNDGTVDNSFFPTGYKAFYCMKYEITQAQYAAFLKMLTPGQAATRYDATKFGSNGYNITSTYTTTTPERACNFLSFEDVLAYLDWAALRPMSSLEYEKAARGPEYPSLYDMTFGPKTSIVVSTGVTNAGLANETSSTANANCRLYNTTEGQANTVPYRVGSFAASATNRVQSGASYYGIMNLSDNVSEANIFLYQQVDFNASYDQFRNFGGVNGDGALDNVGKCNVTLWPTTTTANLIMYKGAGIYPYDPATSPNALGISANSGIGGSDTRYYYSGGRGARNDW